MKINQYVANCMGGGQIYGTTRVFSEIRPHLDDIHDIYLEKTDMIGFGLGIFRSYWNNRKTGINHFTEPMMGFMGHIRPENSMLTVHDCIPKRMYGFPTIRDKIIFENLIEKGYRKFDHIMTISETSKTYICSDYGVSPQNVHVVPLGVNRQEFFPDKSMIRDKMAVPEDALLIGTVGNYRDHKNLRMLLEVLIWLHQQGIKAYAARAGYFSGTCPPETRGRDQFFKLIEENHMQGYFRTCGYIPELRQFYNALDVYLAPSLMEGFDLPMVEAMACGIPIIASDIPVHREVARDAVDYRSMGRLTQIDEIGGDVIHLWHNQKEKMYERMDLVSELTWERSGKALMQAYKEMQ